MKPISDASDIILGCDPEIFFSKGGKVVGAEKILPKSGLSTAKKIQYKDWQNILREGMSEDVGGIIIDGVQAEINPHPSTCRQTLANIIQICFRELYATAQSKGAVPNFSTAVNVPKEEFESLSAESKRLGCSPSANLKKEISGKISVKAATSLTRSAGGHIHLGKNYSTGGVAEALSMPERTVKMLDYICGNTCVMVDRDPGNKKRRETYGRAGEYRTPTYGIEYRTLSNFWLKNYTLFSMAFSLARDAVHIVSADIDGKEGYEKRIIEAVPYEDIEMAINENRYMLAMRNFNKIAPIMSEIVKDGIGTKSPFAPIRINEFRYFLRRGTHWFKQDPVTYWANGGMSADQHGLERFLDEDVKSAMLKKPKIAIPIQA